MRLTVYTDYALRLLMYLALKEDGLATISEVAEGYDISKNHLMKVAHQLGVAGYVDTIRGRNGGLRLAKPAKAIGLGEVVRHTEPDGHRDVFRATQRRLRNPALLRVTQGSGASANRLRRSA